MMTLADLRTDTSAENVAEALLETSLVDLSKADPVIRFSHLWKVHTPSDSFLKGKGLLRLAALHAGVDHAAVGDGLSRCRGLEDFLFQGSGDAVYTKTQTPSLARLT